jgi:hypothetical protein
MPLPGSRQNPYVRAACGHWTTAEYCESHGAEVYEHIKTVEEGGRLKKDGTLDESRKELRTDILCAKCRPKTEEEIEEEKKRRKEYALRKRLRDALEMRCPVCGNVVRPRRDSEAFEQFTENKLNREEVQRLIFTAHIRHEHTDYDNIRHEEYKRLRSKGFDWELAHEMAKETARKRTADKVQDLMRKYWLMRPVV